MKAAILVFAGPSLLPADRPSDPAIGWRPPAAAGDLLRLLADPPCCVCLIDGCFDARPAVWHKEILLLLELGTRVLGAASMGALRAAELHPFGMEGVGAIFRAYRDGRLTGDDEVALVHSDAARGWRPLTEPLVEVRATLLAAVRGHVLAPASARALLGAAMRIHFRDRDWPAMLRGAALPATPAAQFAQWLRRGRVRLKRQDALHCLAAAQAPRIAAAPAFVTPRTVFIAALAREVGTILPCAPNRAERIETPRRPAP